MSKLPSMPFFVDDYIKDTPHLSLEEHGAYLLLLMAMWQHKGAIPDDDRDNARLLRLQPRVWLRLKPRLMPFFETYGGQITQKNLQRRWNYAVENSARQSVKGKLGVKARMEQKQTLGAIPGLSRGNSPGTIPGSTPASTAEQAQVQAQVKHLRKKDITTTSNSPAKVAEEVTEKPVETFPELPDNLNVRNRLLDTPLMRRAR